MELINQVNYELQEMNEADLEMVLEWRNNPQVRFNMYSTGIISQQEHRAWWQEISKNKSVKYLIYLDHKKPTGLVYFTQINTVQQTATWAFYTKEEAPKGSGTKMEALALQMAFESLNLRKLNCEVIAHNAKVIQMHQKFGFRIEGVFKQHHLVGDRHEDVYRMAIFSRDWQKYLAKQTSSLFESGKIEGDPTVGDKFESTFSIDIAKIEAFGNLTGDLNPIHFSEEAAKAAGFNGRISHGVLLLGEVSRILGSHFPGNGTIISNLTINFLKPVYPSSALNLKFFVLTKIGNRFIINFQILEQEDLLLQGACEVLKK